MSRSTTHRWPKRLRPTLIAAVAVAGLAGSGLVAAGTAQADEHVEIPPGDGEQFVWPMSSWIAANHEYASGVPHVGSADLAAQIGAPVYPSRAGEVLESRYYSGGWQVRILHEGDDGSMYRTNYHHLMDEPLVAQGEDVDVDTLIAYNGRTGVADKSGPHIHFSISVLDDDEKWRYVKIPSLEIGDWVHAGDHIPGVYEGLDSMDAAEHEFDVRVTEPDGLSAYETPSRLGSEIVGELPSDEVVTVLETDVGQYRVDVDGELGWIPHSGTAIAEHSLHGVSMTNSGNGLVRSSPDASDDDNIIGVVLPTRTYLTGYESDGDWHRVLWPCSHNTNRSQDDDDDGRVIGGCPGRDDGASPQWKYGWVGPGISEVTSQFMARARQDSMPVYGNQQVDGEDQPDLSNEIGDAGDFRSQHRILDTRNGWYRVDHDGQIGWIRGWQTAGRQ